MKSQSLVKINKTSLTKRLNRILTLLPEHNEKYTKEYNNVLNEGIATLQNFYNQKNNEIKNMNIFKRIFTFNWYTYDYTERDYNWCIRYDSNFHISDHYEVGNYLTIYHKKYMENISKVISENKIKSFFCLTNFDNDVYLSLNDALYISECEKAMEIQNTELLLG